MFSCTVGDYGTALVAVLMAVVLVVREVKRETSGGIPPRFPDVAAGVTQEERAVRSQLAEESDG